MSDKPSGKVSEPRSSKVFIFSVLGIVAVLVAGYLTRDKFDKNNLLDSSQAFQCLNGYGLNKMPDEQFENICLGKSFEVFAFPENCSYDNDCELSLSNTRMPGFDDDKLFEADLVEELPLFADKVLIKGVVVDRGFFGQVEVNVAAQEVVPLSPEEVAALEKALKPKVDPVAEAQRRWLEEREAENAKMRAYAETNDRELTAKSTRVQVDPDSVNGMAEYRYYLKSGNVVSCVRGFEANVFIYECTNHKFN